MQVLLWTSDSSAQAQAALTHPDSSTFAVRAVLSRTVQENQFAIPGVNVVSSSSVNACMEAAKKVPGAIFSKEPDCFDGFTVRARENGHAVYDSSCFYRS